MKWQTALILVLAIAVVLSLAKIGCLYDVVYELQNAEPDTIGMRIALPETSETSQADAVEEEYVPSGDSLIYVFPTMYDTTSFPLFNLAVKARTRDSSFVYDVSYIPIKIQAIFKGIDVSKDFKIHLTPEYLNNLAEVSIDFSGYSPPKISKRRFGVFVGASAGYNLSDPGGMAGLAFGTFHLGVEGSERGLRIFGQKVFYLF